MVVFEHLSTTNLRMDEFHVGLCLETTAQAEYENLHSRLVVGALWTVVSWMIHPWLVDEMEITIRFEYTRKQKPSMNLFRYVQKRLLLLQGDTVSMSLYINLPWIINERDYNCSGRTVSEWLARGQIDYVQGIYFAVSGSIFLVFYLLTLIVIYRESMLDHSCYRLMFFGGVIDVICLIIGSHLTAYFHIRGTVFCSDPLLDQFAGHSTWSLWNGSSLNCVILAINRAIEMLPLLQGFRFLFRGYFVNGWMLLCLFYMLVRPFITRPCPFNSKISSYFFPPLISDDIAWLFLQVLCICVITTANSLLNVYINYVESPAFLITIANILWQLNHGIHGIIYMAMNQQIRRGVWSLLRRGRTGAKSSSVGSLVKTHKKEHEITNHASAQ
ncbi:hypothetical protein RB195_016270 [Necator americanus]|uniref:7TM GPCR serpentine receptor class x (Srx) domain-containing protein n=1 Tax=Necator americanus TaxID=51031 RepID=A0ABR1EA87_NECAM